MLTYEEKLKKVMDGFNLSKTESHEKVMFLDWVEREEDFLTQILPQFRKDFDKNATLISMAVALWEDESTGIKKENLFLN